MNHDEIIDFLESERQPPILLARTDELTVEVHPHRGALLLIWTDGMEWFSEEYEDLPIALLRAAVVAAITRDVRTFARSQEHFIIYAQGYLAQELVP